MAITHGIADLGLPVLIATGDLPPRRRAHHRDGRTRDGEMVAGSSRLVFGGLQLLLLAFGIVAGANLVGLPRTDSLRHTRDVLGPWAPWLGVIVFGVATAVYFSAPRRAMRWLLCLLLVAWVGQLVGSHLLGASASGFCGALP